MPENGFFIKVLKSTVWQNSIYTEVVHKNVNESGSCQQYLRSSVYTGDFQVHMIRDLCEDTISFLQIQPGF